MSAILVVFIMTSLATGASFVMIKRARGLAQLSQRQQRRSRDQELHWSAIRLRSDGNKGHDLQERLCAETNCTPAEADSAIFRVGAHI